MRKRSLTIWFLLLAALTLVGAGCGGDDGGGGSSSDSGDDEEASEPLDEDEFQDQGGEICTDIGQGILDIRDDADLEPGDYEGARDFFADVQDLMEGGLEDLQDITPPEDSADDYEEFVSLIEDATGTIEDLVGAAEDEDDDALDELGDDFDDTLGDAGDLADDLGFECGGDMSDDFSDSSDFSDFSSDFSDDFSSDFSDDFSSDFSDDFSSDFSDDATLGIAQAPNLYITEYGSDPTFDDLADSCYDGNLADCDELYRTTPADPSTFSYEGYGATCGGRLTEERPNQCVSLG
jgi:hypothetical protein